MMLSESIQFKMLFFWSVVTVLETVLAFTSSSCCLSSYSAPSGHRHHETWPPPSSSSEPLSILRFATPANEGGDDDGDADDDDWRTFRAKLVMSEGGESMMSSSSSSPSEQSSSASNTENNDNKNSSIDDSDLDGIGALFSENFTPSSTTTTTAAIPGFTPLEPSQWAYYSGKVIEQGAVILGGVEQDFGFGLRQQYFHKAVILVLDHDESKFTKGIILNRPSNRVMEDDVNIGLQWKVWFGGDVQGLDSLLPDIVCLHSLRSKEARDASVSVMKDIQWTSFANAKKLVKKGVASGPEDFWSFVGYAGWGPGQLSGELDRKSWYMCATDSRTLLKELARQSRGVDPRDAGLETWTLLMNMIGKGETVNRCNGGFDDLMLKEWSQANLVRSDGEEVALTSKDPFFNANEPVTEESNELSNAITAGVLLRGSSADRSPFLLEKQQFHHSLLLILLSDDKLVIGCMLNHPATKGCEVGGNSIPVRYGGDYAIKGQSPMIWLHSSPKLRDLGVGTPSGEQRNGVYTCTQEEATDAVLCGVAESKDFLVTSGVCVWSKVSLANDVKRGVFELVESSKVQEAMSVLRKQEILTEHNLDKNISFGDTAWRMARATSNDEAACDSGKEQSGFSQHRQIVVGLGEGFDEDDETVVFNSDKKVSELANDALRKWVATFLLGAPTLASS